MDEVTQLAMATMNNMIRLLLFMTNVILATLAAAEDFVGGEADISTPQVRLIEPAVVILANEPVSVHITYSADFVYCADCAASLPEDYGQLPQVAQQGHAHTYLQKIPEDAGFSENNVADGIAASFCALNQSNPTTEIGPGFVKGKCPSVAEPGRYRMGAVLQTDSHILRVMAHPQHFPSIDCRILTVTDLSSRE